MRSWLPICLLTSLAGLMAGGPAWAAGAAPVVALPALIVRVLPGTDASVLHDLEHVRVAKGAEAPALQLDLAHRRVLNATGQIVAGPDSVRTPYLQSVVDKWRYVASLGAFARAHPQELHSDWGYEGHTPRPWVGGTDATFWVPHVPPGRQLLVFGIGPSGDIYYLRAGQVESPGVPGDTMFTRATAVPPFGAEHIVAVTAADPQGIGELRTWLAENSESHGVIDTQGEVLRQIEALRDVRIGLLASYTCLSAPECVP